MAHVEDDSQIRFDVFGFELGRDHVDLCNGGCLVDLLSNHLSDLLAVRIEFRQANVGAEHAGKVVRLDRVFWAR